MPLVIQALSQGLDARLCERELTLTVQSGQPSEENRWEAKFQSSKRDIPRYRRLPIALACHSNMETQCAGPLSTLVHRGHQEPDIDVSNLRIKEGRVGVAISHYRIEHFPCGVVTVGRPDASADSSPQF